MKRGPRASCQSCKSVIVQSEIRVAVSAMSPYQKGDYTMRYYHATCYSNRKDFTKFYGFRDLTKDDREVFMNKQQSNEISTSSITSNAAAVKQSTGKRNSAHLTMPPENSAEKLTKRAPSLESDSTDADSYNVAAKITPGVLTKKVSGITPSKDLRRIVVNPYLKNKSISNLTITGIQYGQVCAYSNQKVSLVREPKNKFDKNAVKVTNLTGKSIGHIKKEQALSLSARLAKLGNDITVDCTVINNGDGYNQKLLCVFQKKNTKEGDPVASASANSTSTTVVAITPSKIVSPYLTK
mmetsp:Transcript_34008/g.38013  ORF Transcript_34008/g.38013 Transcript_34008/m.38013 type:complete len:296 (-) Transcript_34008:214-1101(-)